MNLYRRLAQRTSKSRFGIRAVLVGGLKLFSTDSLVCTPRMPVGRSKSESKSSLTIQLLSTSFRNRNLLIPNSRDPFGI